MTDYNDLIQRLLSWTETSIKNAAVRAEAVNAIRELVVERDDAEEAVSAATDLKQKWRDRAEKAEEENNRLNRQIDSRTMAMKDQMVRAERAEADLAVARKALEALACLGNGGHPGNSVGNVTAQRALAAIAAARAEGGKND